MFQVRVVVKEDKARRPRKRDYAILVTPRQTHGGLSQHMDRVARLINPLSGAPSEAEVFQARFIERGARLSPLGQDITPLLGMRPTSEAWPVSARIVTARQPLGRPR